MCRCELQLAASVKAEVKAREAAQNAGAENRILLATARVLQEECQGCKVPAQPAKYMQSYPDPMSFFTCRSTVPQVLVTVK